MYKRADGTFVALPVVIKGDVVSFALPSISGVVEVVFTAAVGTRQETLQSEKSSQALMHGRQAKVLDRITN